VVGSGGTGCAARTAGARSSVATSAARTHVIEAPPFRNRFVHRRTHGSAEQVRCQLGKMRQPSFPADGAGLAVFSRTCLLRAVHFPPIDCNSTIAPPF